MRKEEKRKRRRRKGWEKNFSMCNLTVNQWNMCNKYMWKATIAIKTREEIRNRICGREREDFAVRLKRKGARIIRNHGIKRWYIVITSAVKSPVRNMSDISVKDNVCNLTNGNYWNSTHKNSFRNRTHESGAMKRTNL